MTVYKQRLYAPGPVEVPPQVLAALARPVPHHRSPAFREMFMSVRDRLAELMLVPGEDVLVVTGSGTAGFEAALVTALPAGSTVLALSAGKFGERWAQMARRLGHEVVGVIAAAGSEFDLAEVASALAASKRIDAVSVVHSETSTGALHDVARIAALVREYHPEALVLVDAVTSLAAAELRPRTWDVDAVVSGSQKGVMCPPGLAFVWLSERAWRRSAARSAGASVGTGYYLDLNLERPKQAQGETAFTPAVSLVAGLDVALDVLLAEGVESLWSRREALNSALLAAGAAIGLRPFAARPSPAVAAMSVPEGVLASRVVAAARSRGATLASGQDELRDVLVRPSLLGWNDRYDAVMVAALLEDALLDAGGARTFERGSAVAAAVKSLDSAFAAC